MHFNVRPFNRLQWQLSLSYTLVAAGALLVVELILLLGVILMINSDTLTHLLVRTFREQFSAQLRPYLDKPEPDAEGLARFMNAYSQDAVQAAEEGPRTQFWTAQDASENMLVLDRDGNLLWSQFPPAVETAEGVVFDPSWVPGLPEILPNALANDPDVTRLYRRLGNLLVIAVPVVSADGERAIGAMVMTLQMPSITNPTFMGQLLPPLLASFVIFTLGAGLVGSIFGYFTARRLTRRLARVSAAADGWSRGDFSSFIRDPNDDELSELTRRLNLMAEHLQNLLHTRQELAALEERNRIARELHDSVKQQVFATAMQVGAARAMLPDDDSPAAERLREAERLTHQAQSELTSLIQALRPVALEGKGLVLALREMTAEWGRQTGIQARFDCPSPTPLKLPILMEQAMFRVAQESLANIARHSGARNVKICLEQRESEARLTITDDGQGFDPADADGKGVGLRSMRERVEPLGGKLEIRSAVGKGTQVILSMPCNGAANKGTA